MSILFAGPWVGEFGWELFGWQAKIRKLAKEYDKTIISSRECNRYLYSDFSDEFIPFLKSRGITGENVDSVLSALEDFWAEQKNQGKIAKAKNLAPRVSKNHSGHPNTKTPQPYIIDQGEKTIVATFKHNPQILSLLESLITRDIGVRTIHSKLKKKGYNIPQRTVTRWVSKMRSKELL